MNLIIHDLLIGEMRAYEFLWNYRLPYRSDKKIVNTSFPFTSRPFVPRFARPTVAEKDENDEMQDIIREINTTSKQSSNTIPILYERDYIPPPSPSRARGGWARATWVFA